VIGTRVLPEQYERWNRRWHAPYGRTLRAPTRIARVVARNLPKIVGPFGLQGNNSTRHFEYPWAYYAVPTSRGVSVLEIGGAVSGFQFTIAKTGASVTNADPAEHYYGNYIPVTASSMKRLNRAFGTDVTLFNGYVEEAQFGNGQFDVVYSISTIEHIPPDELPALVQEIDRVLAPGGSLVLTVDLFLDVTPFAEATENRFGTNVAPFELMRMTGYELVQGVPEELLGFPAFDPDRIRAQLDRYWVGGYPCVAQCFVLKKPASAAAT